MLSQISKQIGFTEKPISLAKSYVTAIRLFLLGNPNLLIPDKAALGPGWFLASTIVLVHAIMRVIWPSDPIGSLELPATIERFTPLFKLIPYPWVTLVVLYILVSAVPLFIITRALGFRPSLKRVVIASLYLAGLALLVITATFPLVAVISGLAEDEQTSRSIKEFALFAIAVIFGVRAWKFLGIAHRTNGIRLLLINISISLPLYLAVELLAIFGGLTWPSWLTNPIPVRSHWMASFHMSPTLPRSSTVLVNTILPVSQLKRGDIITYYLPRSQIFGAGTVAWQQVDMAGLTDCDLDQPGPIQVSRIVALAGDRISLGTDGLMLNGVGVERVLSGSYQYSYGHPDLRATEFVTEYKEEIEAGRQYRILEGENVNEFSEFGELIIPAGHVFVLGDFRTNSLDSRLYGPIAEICIVAKAYFALWPMNVSGTL